MLKNIIVLGVVWMFVGCSPSSVPVCDDLDLVGTWNREAKTYCFHNDGNYSLSNDNGYGHSGTWSIDRGEICLNTSLGFEVYIKYTVTSDFAHVYLNGFRYFRQ